MFDAHTHLDRIADPIAAAARARSAGVTGWVIAGTRPDAWDTTLAVAAATGGIAVLGIHPWWADEADDDSLERLRQAEATGLGELGLDGLRGPPGQLAVFRAQLEIARERNLPVVLHCVRAYPELFRVCRDDGLPAAGGMIHAWSGPPAAVAQAVALGLHVSLGPRVLRENARRVRRSVPLVPLDRLLIETDCPDGTDEPAGLVAVLAEVAHLRGEAQQHVAAAADTNLRRLFPSIG